MDCLHCGRPDAQTPLGDDLPLCVRCYHAVADSAHGVAALRVVALSLTPGATDGAATAPDETTPLGALAGFLAAAERLALRQAEEPQDERGRGTQAAWREGHRTAMAQAAMALGHAATMARHILAHGQGAPAAD